MESSSNVFTAHPLPHQQFSSRIAFANNYSKIRLNSLPNKKSTTRLPPITRYDSICSPPTTNDSIRYFNISSDSIGSSDGSQSSNGVEPDLRIQQLERNLGFVKHNCQQILQSLHLELEELKVKNRDLQFQLIANGSDLDQKELFVMPLIEGSLEPKSEEYIHKLENEVKRLRTALSETLRINSLYRQELQTLKTSKKEVIDNSNPMSSPSIGEFNKTLDQINKTISNSNQKKIKTNLPRITNSGPKLQ